MEYSGNMLSKKKKKKNPNGLIAVVFLIPTLFSSVFFARFFGSLSFYMMHNENKNFPPKKWAQACLQSFLPPPPPPMSAPPSRLGTNNLTYSSPPSPDLIYDQHRIGGQRQSSKRLRDHSLHRYA